MVVLVALVAVMAPANAKGRKPVTNAAPTVTPPGNVVTLIPSEWYPDSPCTFDVEYHWAGIKGRDFTASINLVDSSGATIASMPQATGVGGDGWELFFVKFYESVGAARDVYARASLSSGGAEVAESVVTSPSMNTVCGGRYGVVAPTVVPM